MRSSITSQAWIHHTYFTIYLGSILKLCSRAHMSVASSQSFSKQIHSITHFRNNLLWASHYFVNGVVTQLTILVIECLVSACRCWYKKNNWFRKFPSIRLWVDVHQEKKSNNRSWQENFYSQEKKRRKLAHHPVSETLRGGTFSVSGGLECFDEKVETKLGFVFCRL